MVLRPTMLIGSGRHCLYHSTRTIINRSRKWTHGCTRTLASTTTTDPFYDVVIIGGGIAGTSLACALASNPAMKDYRVALVEAMDLSNTIHWSNTSSYSNRVVSLTPSSMRFLSKIGVAEHMYPNRVHPYSRMKVWDGVSGAHIEFDSALLGIQKENAIAYMVENAHLQHAMLKQLDYSCSGAEVHVLQRARVASISLDQGDKISAEFDLTDWPSVHLASGDVLKARLLVGADGVNSSVRKFAKIESLGWDYNMYGVVATLNVDTSDKPNDTAYQRFLPTGPIAMLPLGDGQASMVWSIHPNMANMLKKIPENDFITLVNGAFRMSFTDLSYLFSQIDPHSFTPQCDFQSEYSWRQDVAVRNNDHEQLLLLPPIVNGVVPTSRASFPLRMRNSQFYFGDRTVLIGDAAHTIHPLAGQGLNQGLLDVECLADTLQRGVLDGQDIGNTHLLREYASQRYLGNLIMISACDKLHRLYNTDFGPLTWLRSVGLSLVNNSKTLKTEIMRYAMGIEGNH